MFNAAAIGQAPGLAAAWAGVVAYALQIYFDFSAYSDMAIGLGRMFGIVLPINFAAPYKARSIIDFWRRWHITLSRFLRAYLYIPLGGNRRGPVRRQLNIFLTVLLGGIWHGAGWTFVLWGAIHGLLIVGNHLWRESRWYRPLPAPLAWLLTMLAVFVAWVPFRAADLGTTARVLAGLVGANGLARLRWPGVQRLSDAGAAAGRPDAGRRLAADRGRGGGDRRALARRRGSDDAGAVAQLPAGAQHPRL